MPTTEEFTREFARLVWLLVHRPHEVEDQKTALRASISSCVERRNRIIITEVTARLAERATLTPPEPDLAWTAELSHRMVLHAVRSIEFLPKPRATEILSVARALAIARTQEEQGEQFDQVLAAWSPTITTVRVGREGVVRHVTPPTRMASLAARPITEQINAVLELPPAVYDAPQLLEGAAVTNDPTASFLQSAAATNSKPHSLDDLLIRLRGDLSPETAPLALDEIGRSTEELGRRGQVIRVVEVLERLFAREAEMHDPEVLRSFAAALKRIAVPAVLRPLAEMLPTRRELRDTLHTFFVRSGAAGADVLVDKMIEAESPTERRAYRDVLAHCPEALSPLTHLLQDERWFVVRNAADLLGELAIHGSEDALIEATNHEDMRVRKSATLALIKLGTPRAAQTIVRALQDSEADVRMKAALGVTSVTNVRYVPAVIEALDKEEDNEVAAALMSVLAKQSSSDAVERLIKEAKASLFSRRPAARRLAAVQALGESNASAARGALRSLTSDRDRAVKALAEKLLQATEEQTAIAYTPR